MAPKNILKLQCRKQRHSIVDRWLVWHDPMHVSMKKLPVHENQHHFIVLKCSTFCHCHCQDTCFSWPRISQVQCTLWVNMVIASCFLFCKKPVLHILWRNLVLHEVEPMHLYCCLLKACSTCYMTCRSDSWRMPGAFTHACHHTFSALWCFSAKAMPHWCWSWNSWSASTWTYQKVNAWEGFILSG